MTTIDIYNSDKEPFVQLSNNYKLNIKIYDSSNKLFENWGSVSNYIYDNMLTYQKHKQILKNHKDLNTIYEKYIKFRNIEEEDIIKSALKKSLFIKFQDPQMAKILISTGRSDILYLSDNTLLGKNNERKGKNILGKYLMEIRSMLKVKTKDIEIEEEKNNMYKSFVIYELLKTDIEVNGDDLSKYLNNDKIKNIDELIELYIKNHPENPTLKINIGQSIIDKYRKNNFLELYPKLFELLKLSISKPDILIHDLRKNFLDKLKINNKIFRNKKSFKVYFDYIINKRYPNVPEKELKKIKDMEFAKISVKEQNDILKISKI